MMTIGVAFRWELAEWIASQPAGVECLEITAEHFYQRGEERLAELSREFQLFVHGVGLSLGTPGKIDEERLANFARVVEIAQPEWISEHIAFTRTPEVDLGHLNPIQPTSQAATVIAAHAREVADRCGRPIILENITSHLRLEGDLSETDFLNEVCERAGCGLLLDITNLFINSRNHHFDPFQWLQGLDPALITQLHIVGYSFENGRYADGHAQPVQNEVIDLARAVLAYAPVRGIILERDEDFPGPAVMAAEIRKLERLRERN